MYSASVGWNVLYILVNFTCYSIVHVLALFLFCLIFLSIIESGILKSHFYCVTVYFSFNSVNLCFTYLGAVLSNAYIFIIVISSCWIDTLTLHNNVLLLSTVFDLMLILCNLSLSTLFSFGCHLHATSFFILPLSDYVLPLKWDICRLHMDWFCFI